MHIPSKNSVSYPRATWRGVHACSMSALVFASSVLSGCAAITNPVAEGIPVRRLPPEFRGPSRAGATIPLPLLSQKPVDVYRLAAGDVLGIWIEGVLGDRTQTPPIYTPPAGATTVGRRFPPAVGF